MTTTALDPRRFEVAGDGVTLAGEEVGEGAPIVAAHGLTATRRYVVHGSRVLPRRGFRLITYDARGHGASDPAPAGAAYTYGELARDLAAVIEARVDSGSAVLAGHSMGAHTIVAHALAAPERVAGMVIVGPAVHGGVPGEAELEGWERLAQGLERGGTEGFVAAVDDGLDPEWRERVLELTRSRIALHEHPDAVARALREVPGSAAFSDLTELERLEAPTLIVASHDTADPGHPYAVAQEWAERIPNATLISEEEGDSPLAWQGGKLSREIASFCGRPEVAGRLRG